MVRGKELRYNLGEEDRNKKKKILINIVYL